MEDFYKRKDGEYLEGYLGDPEKFNGIVFMLKEPNQEIIKEGEIDKRFFWMKNVIYGKRICEEDISEARKKSIKIAASTYKNRFKQMLRFIERSEDDLYDAIFCNVHPEFGEATETEESKENAEVNALNKMKLLERCAKKQKDQTLIIFTCKKTYEVLERKYIEEGCFEQETDGLRYVKRNPMKKFTAKTEDYALTVYEVLHPIRTPSIDESELRKQNHE